MIQQITPLPAPPQPSDSPIEFDQKSFALLGGLPQFVDQANALGGQIFTIGEDATESAAAALASKNAAATSASNSAASAIASGQSASNSASSANAANQSRIEAQSAAEAAAASATKADSAQFLSLNYSEDPSAGRLQVFQGENAPEIMPNSGWWSLIRVQHPGYQAGYWQDLALPFVLGARPRVRQNAGGEFSQWKELAYSSDVQTVADSREPSISSSDATKYWRGDKTWQVLDKTSVGLSNVDNTSDANKPVSTAQAVAINEKIASEFCSIAGFVAGGTGMYMRRTTDNSVHEIASRTATSEQGFTGGINAPTVVARGSLSGFVKRGSFSAGSGLIASKVMAVEDMDAQTIFALLRPGVESSWRFDTGAANFYMKNTGVGYSTGGWAATSDNRVKYNVRPIESALDKICQLTGYTYIRQDMFDMQGNMPIRSGVIAQEVLQVLPSTVNVPANYDPVKNQGDLLSVSMDGLVGLLINAVKELRQEVNALKQLQ